MKGLKEFCGNYKSLVGMFIYMICYLLCFNYLEQRQVAYYQINFGIDAYIPFCELFVIPYVLWFFYVSAAVLVLAFLDQEEGNKLNAFLMIGMTVFIIVSAIFPNGHHLRPRVFVRDNIFINMVKVLYRIDTPTNILPSIHVYNSVAVMIAVMRTRLLKNHSVIKWSLMGLGLSIICSTVLIKQHSVLDVTTALILSVISYSVCYRNEYVNRKEVAKAKI